MLAWYQAWMEELSKLATDPFLAERNTTDAFVSIVANFLEHFETQQDIVESFAIINGTSSLGLSHDIQDLQLLTLRGIHLLRLWHLKSMNDWVETGIQGAFPRRNPRSLRDVHQRQIALNRRLLPQLDRPLFPQNKGSGWDRSVHLTRKPGCLLNPHIDRYSGHSVLLGIRVTDNG